MASSNDNGRLVFDQKLFDPASISNETHAFNQHLMDIMATGPKWFEVGAAAYRKMRAEGKTPLPGAKHLDSAITYAVPSRDTGREIPCRMFKPIDKPSDNTSTGVFMHIHGGGWVLQDEASQDPVLQALANKTGTLVISVGYRLAPEHPFPAGPNDCFDVAEWLVDNSTSKLGAPLSFIGGESAGGHLSALTALHLLQHSKPTYADFRLRGLVLHFGVYDMTFSPSIYNFEKPGVLVLDAEIMEHYREAFVPGATYQRLKQPDVSPLFTNLEKLRGKLPPALFTCGTEDPLLDDTIFMSSKWMMAGAEVVVKIVPGGAHGYLYFLDSPQSGCNEGMIAMTNFVTGKL